VKMTTSVIATSSATKSAARCVQLCKYLQIIFHTHSHFHHLHHLLYGSNNCGQIFQFIITLSGKSSWSGQRLDELLWLDRIRECGSWSVSQMTAQIVDIMLNLFSRWETVRHLGITALTLL
jgi:hypothetical protein